MRKNILSFLRYGLRSIAFAVTALVFALNIIYYVTISYDGYEHATIHNALGIGMSLLAAFAVTIVLLALLREKVECKKEECVFILLSAIYCIGAAYLILNVEPVLRADAAQVSSAAEKLRVGNLEAFQTGYLNLYPHQIGLVLYDFLLDCFSMNPAIQFVVNVLFVIGTNYLLYSISKYLFEDHLTNILTILLSFCFLPQLFLILFAYGNIPSFFFLTLAFYNLLKFAATHHTRNIFYGSMGAAVAVFLRSNTLIGVIAMIIYLILDAIKKYNRKNILFVLLLILATVFPADIVYQHFLQKTPVQDAGIPSVIWVVMGTDIDNDDRAPGWHDSTLQKIYVDANRDPELTREIGVQRLEENLQKMQKEPKRTATFFAQKLVSQWCDPLFQSIWSGPLETSGQETYTKLLKSLYNGEDAEHVVAFLCRFYVIAIWGMAVLFLVKDSAGVTGWEPMFMFLIGGFLFHIVWEAKSQYNYQYLLCLVPFGAYSLARRIRDVSDVLLKGARQKR